MKVRKKPVVVDAVLWTGANWLEIKEFCPIAVAGPGLYEATIPTLEGNHTASNGDWIVRGVAGEFYPVKGDIFTQTYDLVDSATS